MHLHTSSSSSFQLCQAVFSLAALALLNSPTKQPSILTAISSVIFPIIATDNWSFIWSSASSSFEFEFVCRCLDPHLWMLISYSCLASFLSCQFGSAVQPLIFFCSVCSVLSHLTSRKEGKKRRALKEEATLLFSSNFLSSFFSDLKLFWTAAKAAANPRKWLQQSLVIVFFFAANLLAIFFPLFFSISICVHFCFWRFFVVVVAAAASSAFYVVRASD